jgi:hypothetical protein
MRSNDTKRIARQTRRINGWFSRDAAGLFGLLDKAQREADVHGDLFEVGAHHGKSTVMLGAMTRPDESLGVCDIFGNQGANVSGSGSGDREIFERNMRRLVPSAKVSIYEKLSTDLTPEEIGGPYRFFHVDGGHRADEALRDLQLAASVLDPRGVIVLDDPFRPEWPGVTEALLDFLREHGEFVPVALGFNKLVLTSVPAVYDVLATELVWEYIPANVFLAKTQTIAGRNTLIFYIPTYRRRICVRDYRRYCPARARSSDAPAKSAA